MELYGRYFRTYRKLFFFAVFFVFLETMVDLLQPTLMARIIDDGIRRGEVSRVLQLGGLMLGATALGAGFAALRNILASRVSQRFGQELREDLFRQTLYLGEGEADALGSGSLVTRLTNDTAQCMQFANGMMRIFFKAPITALGSVILAFLLSPQLSLVLFLLLLVVGVLITLSMRLSYTRFAWVQKAMDQLNAKVQEYLLGIRLVKTYGRHETEREKFEGVNGELEKRSMASQRVIAWFSPLLTLTLSLGIALVLYLGSYMFSRGEIEVGKIAAYISYMTQILSSIIMITNIFNTFVRTKASSARILEVLDSPGEAQTKGESLGQALKVLAFDEVSFAYPAGSGVPALKKVTFTLAAGETLAVIGSTGSGKSTLSWLLLRFYEPSDGCITLNGQDIQTLDPGEIRQRIALAPQKPQLFSGTVRENIAWGRPDAPAKDEEWAARTAMAEEFILKMPKGYDSPLRQGGVNLSGGQKQRISIARALAKRGEILILDDATSALDALTEAKVRSALRRIFPKPMTFLITQRVSTAMGADRILVLEEGSVAGWGTHGELLKSCAIYRELYDSQIGLEEKSYGE
ncbi:ABC transporter ATP-binding protein [Proteiniclasticum sp. BAD-10]|uniref:ABC transporter ATP-binding protein n=1 Tax=Proteiniclasticum sediminis TaxID=2804028 RepID=A0A941CPX2_9CLOT|nr:ABC transporter ATP-binding protein [Proteiniclasticum sediminis]MBR0576077.1 ABC transporter ATP-binding protein [Proteiniclasticum sediminis]